MRRLGPRAVALIPGSRLARRNSDVEHKYRAPSDLLYLTGFAEPEAFAVITPGRDEKYTLFLRPRDPDRETWTGRRVGVEGAVARLGADRAWPIADLAARLVDLVDGADELHFLPGDDADTDRLVMATVQTLREGERRGRRSPPRLVDLSTTLHEMRLVKDEDALAKQRRAVAITAEAHVAAMRAARDGMYEYEIEALVDYTFRRRGCSGPGYPTIVGGGANATILHYVDNQDPLRRGDLLLIDAGGEYEGYTADVTRTFPVNARFAPGQRRLYELVLATEKECVALVRPGATIDEIHSHAVRRLTAGMVELGLLTGEVPQLIESGAYKRFFLHRSSHWLGLDVHDVGAYTFAPGEAGGAAPGRDAKPTPRPLVPGMVLTVEPGIYIAADAQDVPAEYRGIGIRIEDDVLVTATGHEVLTAAIPKEIAEIEALTTSASFSAA